MTSTGSTNHISAAQLNAWQKVVDQMISNMESGLNLQASLSQLTTAETTQLQQIQSTMQNKLQGDADSVSYFASTNNANAIASVQAQLNVDQNAGQTSTTVANNNVNSTSQTLQSLQNQLQTLMQMASSVMTIPQTTTHAA